MTLSLYLNNYYETGFDSFKEKVGVPVPILVQVQIKLRAQRKISKKNADVLILIILNLVKPHLAKLQPVRQSL
jgi:hypothetical protein